MKTHTKLSIVWLAAFAFLFVNVMSGCSKNTSESTVNDLKDDGLVVAEDDTTNCSNYIINPSDEITAEETEMLLYMREEEKLARDVYSTLSALYNVPVFRNITKSEQFHMDRVLCLLNYYNIEDPASDETGVFTNPDLQELYNNLISQGSISYASALTVGATIEDVDIYDLEESLGETDNEAIIKIFELLKCGSGNHMRAFSALLSRVGIDYEPQFISAETYSEILESEHQFCASAFVPTYGNACVLNPTDLTDEEVEMLKYMREEEKMAHDVYTTFSNQYTIPVFRNIAKSEQVHMDRVLCILDYYDIEDPASDETGVFTNPDLQELYDNLVAQGSVSLNAALTVGATIEDVDINDLEAYMNQTSNSDFLRIFGALSCGSGNHLRSFTKILAKRGITYTPQYISQERYDEIVNSDFEFCGGNRYRVTD